MKITKRQLQRIIREEKTRILKEFGSEEYGRQTREFEPIPGIDADDPREELANQIRMASKDVHGRKDVYDLEGKTMEELEDILYDLNDSDVVRSLQKMDRDEMEDHIGRDQELSRAEKAPRSQGMGRRPAGRKSQRRMENKMRITKKQLQRIIREESHKLVRESAATKPQRDNIVLENKFRREVRKALIESGGRLDEGFFDKIGKALGKLGLMKITDKVTSAYGNLQRKLGNDKEIPGIDKLMFPLEEAKKMADAILADMKKTPVTHKSSDEEIEAIQDKVAKMMQNFGKFLKQDLEGGGVNVMQAMEIAPSQKKQSKPHQAYEEIRKVWEQINRIYNGGKQRKESLVNYDRKLDYKLRAPYKGKKKIKM